MRNQNSIFTTLGASNHALEEREQHDYYATDPKAVELLLETGTICPGDMGTGLWGRPHFQGASSPRP